MTIQIRNPKLGRAVLDIIDLEPSCLNMSIWGVTSDRTICGTVACLAGHTMIAAGYRLVDGDFIGPDGTRVWNEDEEAQMLLGIDDAFAGFGLAVWFDNESGLDRFRKAVEEAEGRAL